MHSLSSWTWVWGVWGAAFLIRSLFGKDVHGVRYGVVMLATWLVATLSFLVLDAEQAMLPVVAADGSAALITAVYLSHDHDQRGWWILALFGAEMMVRMTAWAFGVWNAAICYDVLNTIFAAQVAIAGGRCALESVRDWWSAVADGPDIHRPGG